MMAIILSAILPCLLALSGSAAADPVHSCDGGNYTAKSAFQSSLDLLLASLSSSNATFFADDRGSPPDRAHGLVLCRGDADPTDCAACKKNAAQDVVTLCPFSKSATVWYDACELRYSDLAFLSTVDSSRDRILFNINNATDVDSFKRLKRKLLDAVTSAANSSSNYFATGTAFNGSGSPTMYARAQCTLDLSPESCGGCLQQQIGEFFSCCGMKQGGVVLGQSCNFRCESYPFFNGKPTVSLGLSAPPPVPDAPPPSPPASPPPPSPNSDKDYGQETEQPLLEAELADLEIADSEILPTEE